MYILLCSIILLFIIIIIILLWHYSIMSSIPWLLGAEYEISELEWLDPSILVIFLCSAIIPRR